MNAEFQKALDQLPSSAGFDHTVHHTVDDLCWICLRELDLVAEREYWLPLAERKRLLKFIQKHGHHVNEADAVYQRGLPVRADDCYINE
ncbi:MAG TPA: hypothetical protein DEP47_14320 [Chloroflexi bacterium]|nr:hypothetical protein [Chloroflexota bacterium]